MNPSPSRPTTSAQRVKLLIPVMALGLVVAIAGIWWSKSNPTYGEAQVLRTIHTIALTRSPDAERADGGSLGPWWISASGVDPLTGELQDFSITSGTMIIAAKSARVEIDAYADTFSFDMKGVVMTRVAPEPDDGGDDQFLIEHDRYRLGPAPFGADIIANAGSTGRSPLAGVPTP